MADRTHTLEPHPERGSGSNGTGTGTRPRTFKLAQPLMTGADIQDFQRVLNGRFAAWGIGLRVPEDGTYGPSTKLAARRVARGLGIASSSMERGMTPTVRVIMRAPSRRSPQQLARARANRPWREALRRKHPLAAAGGAEAAIRKHGGHFEDAIVREAHRHDLPLSLLCAVVQTESNFRNVFGHDAVANPIKSPPGGMLAVTEERYREYLKHRKAGQGSQGVGPMQLTFHTLQDRADKLGGCFKPAANIRVGAELLASNIADHGMREGVRAYNGSGAAAERYADTVLSREREWRTRLAGAPASAPAHARAAGVRSAGAPASPAPPPAAARVAQAPRTFKLTLPPMSGPDVKAFQDLLNHRMEAWGVDLRIPEDGVYGESTRKQAQRVAKGLGIAPADYARGFTPAVRVVMRTPSRRTRQQLDLARRNRGWLRALIKRFAVSAASGGYPLGKRGKLIGTPHAGTHTLGNWQSDNAVDIGIAVGTTMVAMDDGDVVKVRHHPQGGDRFAGDQITIAGEHGNSYFYGHGVAAVRAGQRVRRGQVIGTSGSANGVAHLHFGVKNGDPRTVIGQQR